MSESEWNPRIEGNDGPAAFATEATVLSTPGTITIIFTQVRPPVSLTPAADQRPEAFDIVGKIIMEKSTAAGLARIINEQLGVRPPRPSGAPGDN